MITLHPWSDADFPLLEKLLGDPAMTEHLGGPESAEQLAKRQARYVRITQADTYLSRAFAIHHENEKVGFVGYWESKWNGELVYEMGWSVLPQYQGRGIATEAAKAAIARARAENQHRFLHALPSKENTASNALCKKAGFTLVQDECDVEFPPGRIMRGCDWRLALS